ncbi:MAG: ABC transporter ATP-binding protein/permease [Sandaracinaceae bacterium]|nr:ABC transporter ATP-binding protein/permease [Sandaracinaceae bacterium]
MGTGRVWAGPAARTTPTRAGLRSAAPDHTTARRVATEGDPKPEKRGLEWSALRSLLPYLWPPGDWGLRGRVVVAMLFLAAAKATNVYVPVLYRGAVDALGGEQAAVVVMPIALILGYGGMRVLSLTFGQLRDAVFAKVGQRAIRTVALGVFRHLHALSLAFHLDRHTGGLSRSIERGTRGIQTLLSFTLFNVLPTFVEIAMVTAVLWALLDGWFALVTFATVVIYIAYTITITQWRLKFRREMNDQDNTANSKAIDSLLNFETVKYFDNEEHEARRYDQALERYETAAVKAQTSLALLNIGQSAIIAIGLTTIMYMAARGIVAHELSIGDFVLANTYLLQLYQPLGFFGFVYNEIKQALVDMEKMFVLLGELPQVADAPGAPELVVSDAVVRFEDVEFAYGERPILKGVTFEIPAGHKLAVVGSSGAGKSTLGRLLFRFYDVSGGRITIDGQDLRAVTQASLRRSLGIVPQDTVLFNDTIRYNIAYGRPSASPEEVEEAARMAELHDFVKGLPDGYETKVGERGLKLSGGEKQRVAIARTILKGPPVLLLDEATSALDTATERSIQRHLANVSRGRTTLVIAHRLSTIVDADEIIVLDQGQIAERGSHDALLARDGLYAELWRRQLEQADAPEPATTQGL